MSTMTYCVVLCMVLVIELLPMQGRLAFVASSGALEQGKVGCNSAACTPIIPLLDAMLLVQSLLNSFVVASGYNNHMMMLLIR